MSSQLQDLLARAVCDGAPGGRPSIEVILHALALTLGGARAVGHTHPTALMALLDRREHWAEPPKVILLENHGLIALGQTPAEVLRVMAMCVKAARLRHGTFTMGGPRFLSAADVAHLAGRPDEHYRQRMLEGGG